MDVEDSGGGLFHWRVGVKQGQVRRYSTAFSGAGHMPSGLSAVALFRTLASSTQKPEGSWTPGDPIQRPEQTLPLPVAPSNFNPQSDCTSHSAHAFWTLHFPHTRIFLAPTIIHYRCCFFFSFNCLITSKFIILT